MFRKLYLYTCYYNAPNFTFETNAGIDPGILYERAYLFSVFIQSFYAFPIYLFPYWIYSFINNVVILNYV